MKSLLLSLIILFSSVSFAESKEFRRILTGYLSAAGLSEAQIAQVIYSTPASLSLAPSVNSASDFISQVDKLGQSLQPKDFYQNSLAQKGPGYAKDDLVARLRQEPLTIVIFPGVFGEFIPTHAFEEVFKNKNSAASKEFALKSANSNLTDTSLSMNELKIEDGDSMPMKVMPLIHYFKVASIDDENNQPLVRVVIFDTEPMSLETLGTMRENSQRFTRRLEKFFQLMGVPKNMAFLGYSRGTMVALDTLSYNHSLQKPWLHNVKAMISVGGVTYGTALADDAFNAKSNNGKMLHQLIHVLDNLQNVDKITLEKAGFNNFFTRGIERMSRIISNGELILSLGGAQAKSDDSIIDTIQALQKKTKGTDIKSQLNLMVDVVTNLGLSGNGGGLYDFFTVQRRRIELLCRSIIAAVREMQTSERLKWWQANNLPLHVTYYSVAGTMGEGVNQHPMGFNPDSQDDRMLNGNYNDYKNASNGVLINDSQVAIQRVKFWPELTAILNPSNAGMKAEYLATLGTHHWGLALEIVNANSNGSKNPFPRELLLKALATQVVTDLEKK